LTDVSVVIPTRDRAMLLAVTLAAVMQQRHVDFEVIVVDDGSADDTAAVVDDLGDVRVRMVRHDRSRGMAAARNTAAAAARGTWIALLDDDDLWAPDKLVGQLAVAERARRGWVYAGAVEIDVTGRLLGGTPPPSPEVLVAGLTRRNLMPAGCSNVILRAELLAAAGGFDPALRHLSDWDLWLRLARLDPPACLKAPMVAYRIHAGQTTMDTTGMAAEASLLQARHGVEPAAIHRWAAWSYLRAGRRRAALGCYLQALRAGDLGALPRATATLLHRQPTSAHRPARRPDRDSEWPDRARPWLAELAEAATTPPG